MRILTRHPINAFSKRYPAARSPLEIWYEKLSQSTFHNFEELKAVFGSADRVGKGVIFDIGGNKWRLAAAIHCNTQKVYIREILTHEEYNQKNWKKRHQDFH